MNKIEALCLAGDVIESAMTEANSGIELKNEILEQFVLIEKALKESGKSWDRGFDIGYAEAESDSIRAIRENY
jgi:hypothetical protein